MFKLSLVVVSHFRVDVHLVQSFLLTLSVCVPHEVTWNRVLTFHPHAKGSVCAVAVSNADVLSRDL